MAAPSQNRYDYPFSEGVFYESGGTTYPNDTLLAIGYDRETGGGSSVPHWVYRAMFKVSAVSVPRWLAGFDTLGGVLVYVFRSTADATLTGVSIQVEAGAISDSWDPKDTFFNLEHIFNFHVSWSGVNITISRSGWYRIPLTKSLLANAIAYGIALRVDSHSDGSVFISTGELAPTLRRYYSIPDPTESAAHADLRPTLSSSILAELARHDPVSRADLALSLQAKDGTVDQDLSSIIAVKELSDWYSSKVPFPKTWDISEETPGGLTLLDDGSVEPEDLVGKELVLDFRLVSPLGLPTSILKRRISVLRAWRTILGTLDLKIETMSERLSRAGLFQYDALEPAKYISYSGEIGVKILADLLLGTSQATFEDTGGGALEAVEWLSLDWAFLIQRFAGVWPAMSYSVADAEDRSSVSNLLSEIALLFGLFIGWIGDRLVVYHPAVYRPSARNWRVNLDEDAEAGAAKVARVDPSYFGVSTTSLPDEGEIVVSGACPLSSMGRVGRNAIEIPVDNFDEDFLASAAIGLLTQLAFRGCHAYDRLEWKTDHRALSFGVGDRLVATSEKLGLADDVFLIQEIKGSPMDANPTVVALHFPFWKGAQSLFETDKLFGLWRWIDEDGAFDGSNMAWNPSGIGPDFVLSQGYSATFRRFGWEAPFVVRLKDNENPQVEAAISSSAVAGEIETIEVQIATKGYPYHLYPESDPVQRDWIIWRWGPAGSDAALCLFVRRGPWGTGKAPSAAESRYMLGYTTNWRGNPLSWKWTLECPKGVGSGNVTGSYLARPIDSVAVSIADDEIRLYLNGRLVDSGAYSRPSAANFILRGSGSERIGFGVLRWFRSDDWLAEEELLSENGVDPLYP